MDTPKTILFDKKAASPEIIKSILDHLGKAAPAAIGAVGTAGALDAVQNNGNYKNFDTGRLVNLALNAGLGGAGSHMLSKGNMHGIEVIAGAPLKDMAVNIAATSRDASRYMKENPVGKGFSPLQRDLLVGGGAAATTAAIPALMNISSAAKRIGSGHAVRVSTSVRHNKHHNDDPADTDPQVPLVVEEAPPAPEKKPGLISRLLHW